MTKLLITAFMGGCLICPAVVWSTPEPDHGLLYERPVGHSGTQRELAVAQEDLRISQLTLERIQKQLFLLRQDQNVDPSVLESYQTYLEKVRRMTVVHQNIVQEIVSRGPASPAVATMTVWEPSDPIWFNPPIPDIFDEGTILDQGFDESLAAFDAFLLAEQIEAARRMQKKEASSEQMTDLAREAAEVVDRLRKKGINIDTSASPTAGGEQEGTAGEQSTANSEQQGASGQPTTANSEEQYGSGQPTDTEQPGAVAERTGTAQDSGQKPEPAIGDTETDKPANGTSGGTPSTASGDPGATDSGSSDSGSGQPSTAQPQGSAAPGDDPDQPSPSKGDRPPADDDDIVARQLRKAAESETDPVLKEKLWQEYELYKGSP